MQYFLSFFLFSITIFLFIISLYVITTRNFYCISHLYVFLLITIAIYTAGYGGELLSTTLKHIIFFNTIEYISLSFIPLLWIFMTAEYIKASFIKNNFIRLILPTLSFISLFGGITDPFLHLKYTSVKIITPLGFPVLSFSCGPFYYFTSIYILFSFITGFIILLYSFSTTGKRFKKSLFFMSTGSFFPFVFYILYLLNIKISGIDTAPFSIFFVVLSSGLAIYSDNFLTITPIARSLVFETMVDPVIVIDNQNLIIDFNKSAQELFSNIEKGKNQISDLTNKIKSSYPKEFQITIPYKGNIHYFTCNSSTLYTAKKNIIQGEIILFKDITETTLLLNEMEKQATIDPLTNLFNRRFLMKKAEKILTFNIKERTSLAFIIADLDFFKNINDTYGHLTGDFVLKSVANIFKNSIKYPSISARYGGEEICCLLPNTTDKKAFNIAEEIRKKIEQIQYPADLKKLNKQSSFTKSFITASFGISSIILSSEETYNVSTLLELTARADKALYKAKNIGRNQTLIG